MQNLKSSVHKTFAILEHFTVQKPEWGVTELANEIGANKSTVYRFLSDMWKLGILHKHEETEKYSLGLKLFELGNRVQLKSAFVDKTHPELEEVAKAITETVHIGILKDYKVLHVDKAESPQGLKISSQVGTFAPAHSTALGKVLLANLKEEEREVYLNEILDNGETTHFTNHTIRTKSALKKELDHIAQSGFAIDREETELGLICVGVPILNQAGEVVASLSASGPSTRFKESNVKNYVSILKKGASNIQQKIGFFKP